MRKEAVGPHMRRFLVDLTGVSAPATIELDGGTLNNSLVLGNRIVGSVNANPGHYAQAADALAKADPASLSGRARNSTSLFG